MNPDPIAMDIWESIHRKERERKERHRRELHQRAVARRRIEKKNRRHHR
ncbi:hypothetical protein [Leifsonia aquatica]|nr:hypothetical protein [Leifsonia aquatica]